VILIRIRPISGRKDTILDKITQLNCNFAKEKFESFELVYRVLRPNDRKYLREQSAVYKRSVREVQAFMLPVVSKHCSSCPFGLCCRLSSPKLKINITESIGCFGLIDYLLVRCDTELPAPNFENAQQNLCFYWENGCRLEPDCRSLTCLKFFCKPLRRDLDMVLVNRSLAKVQAVVNNFSMSRLLQKNTD
jgi:hypothetical protein